MSKTILITGSTDGIGLETAKMLKEKGHRVILHGRSANKLERAQESLSNGEVVPAYLGDLSDRDQVVELAKAVTADYPELDVLINNAGVLRAPQTRTPGGLDLRFVVNTVAPYLLTQMLLPTLPKTGRVINLSSAAQSPVDLDALFGRVELDERSAYAQSKLAITMWSRHLGLGGGGGHVVVAVNPGSLLASKMVKEAFGTARGELSQGADILSRAALSEEFETASGRYYDNDSGRFADPHPDALVAEKVAKVSRAVEELSNRPNW
jgi:NAD(P)-dependent dehydrogenase (short-subunit alcohol dehydrogenase family)